MKAITYPRYVLALTSGEVSEEVRNAYLADLGKEETGVLPLGTILSTAVKMVMNGNSSAQAAAHLVRTEYAACALADKLGGYEAYEPLTEALLAGPEYGGDRLAYCKRLTGAVQDVDKAVKDGVYLGAANGLAAIWLILRDLDYIKEVTDYTAGIGETSYGTELFRTLTDTVLAAQSV